MFRVPSVAAYQSQVRERRRRAAASSGEELTTAPQGPRTALPASFKNAAGLGDSITAGSNASTTNERYLNQLTAALSAGTGLVNAGISATVLQNSNDNLGSPRVNNGRDRIVSAVLNTTNKKHLLVMMYGTNDMRWTAGGDINVANYEIDAREMLIAAILNGHEPSEIINGTPPWLSDDGLLAGSAEFSGTTRANVELHIEASLRVSDEFGVYRANPYAAVRDNGGATLIDVDLIHPNDAGHDVISNEFLAATMNANGRVGNIRLSSTTLTSLTVTWDAVDGADHYEVGFFLRGALTAAYTELNAMGPALQYNGIAAGEYSARIRAVYEDGTTGPWGWAVIPYFVGTTLAMHDHFYAADGTIITSMTTDLGGSSWIRQPGAAAPSADAVITNGRVRSNASASRAAYQADDIVPSGANYEVGGYLTARSLGTVGQVGLCARMSTSADTYYFARYLDSVTTPTFSLFPRVATVNGTQIGTNLNRTVKIGEIIKFAIRVEGTTISLLLDDVVQKTGTDANIAAAGRPGFYVAGVDVGADAGPHLNNVYMIQL